jgi:hypothetical protein
VHSDQGWQYKMLLFRAILQRPRVTQSMSRKGQCHALLRSLFLEYAPDLEVVAGTSVAPKVSTKVPGNTSFCKNGACSLQKSKINNLRCFDRELRTLKAVHRYRFLARLPAFRHCLATRSFLNAQLSLHRFGVDQPSLPRPLETIRLVPATISSFLPTALERIKTPSPAFSCR